MSERTAANVPSSLEEKDKSHSFTVVLCPFHGGDKALFPIHFGGKIADEKNVNGLTNIVGPKMPR